MSETHWQLIRLILGAWLLSISRVLEQFFGMGKAPCSAAGPESSLPNTLSCYTYGKRTCLRLWQPLASRPPTQNIRLQGCGFGPGCKATFRMRLSPQHAAPFQDAETQWQFRRSCSAHTRRPCSNISRISSGRLGCCLDLGSTHFAVVFFTSPVDPFTCIVGKQGNHP